eukprot:CAMPEP_0114032830 /NCGR_PEP_ID=MMETSP1159-20121227/5557_1 /TAXON_ID=88271 /ORGANISM="Picocystis salinarum" /LENGTH=33 /assembly_acc=CAM_ASM_000767
MIRCTLQAGMVKGMVDRSESANIAPGVLPSLTD